MRNLSNKAPCTPGTEETRQHNQAEVGLGTQGGSGGGAHGPAGRGRWEAWPGRGLGGGARSALQGPPPRPGHDLRTVGTWLRGPRVPELNRTRSPQDIPRDVTGRKEMDTQAASKRGETVYQVGAGTVSTVSTNIYKSLHRLQTGFSGRLHCSCQLGRGRTRSRGEQ